ncbi:proline--tRNA ligase [Edaphobacter sp. 12200R-103]|uniref:proline--tRNA ligase n=1 Tax=Edaphobacter sp. 12200R-103 TaxID=2703788 RepID=UPI00138C5263|nr:proline--tRNA ligase [Edaphobacter sp. 12200R-103]QHS51462.1 proline--tRNA ligase [Edaphobacter sp. 12200R-103]
MHRWSQLFIPTLREAPADAEVASHKLLLRAGYVRQLGAGIYSYLFLGNRSINKIIGIVREEMDRIGQEFLLPALNPREIWEESGRWEVMGDNMFRLKDRKGADLCLGMTHEEVMTSIARNELRSYKQLPQIWYQIQTKFRDEPRPKSGLLRVRQFIMKDAYSFDIDEAGLDESYNKHDKAYRTIFSRCGLEFVAVEADSGAMGGSASQEFMVYTEAGEDLIASSVSGYAANMEKASSRLEAVEDLAPTGDGQPELVHTPGQRTIEEVGGFLKVKPQYQMKTMAYMATLPEVDHAKLGRQRAVVAFLRGDHTLNETKLSALAGGELRPMTPEEIVEVFKAPAGYLGPIGVEAAPHPKKPGTLVILDKSLEGRKNLIAGANKEEYHLRNVTPERDFKPTVVADIRNVNEGEPDPVDGSPLRIGKAVEIGHIFKLGYKYTKSMGATVLNRDGKEVTPIMGSYGIGIERILTAAIESSATANDGVAFALHPAIAPFQIVVTITNTADANLVAAGEKVAADLTKAGLDVLLDDRDERAGVKFKDADLIGIPFRINIGRGVAEGKVELVDRLNRHTQEIALEQVVQAVTDQVTSNLQTPLPASAV